MNPARWASLYSFLTGAAGAAQHWTGKKSLLGEDSGNRDISPAAARVVNPTAAFSQAAREVKMTTSTAR
jgi:hypothetical protein